MKLSSQTIFLSRSIYFYFSTPHIFETKSMLKLGFRVKPTKNKAQDSSSLDFTPIWIHIHRYFLILFQEEYITPNLNHCFPSTRIPEKEQHSSAWEREILLKKTTEYAWNSCSKLKKYLPSILEIFWSSSEMCFHAFVSTKAKYRPKEVSSAVLSFISPS